MLLFIHFIARKSFLSIQFIAYSLISKYSQYSSQIFSHVILIIKNDMALVRVYTDSNRTEQCVVAEGVDVARERGLWSHAWVCTTPPTQMKSSPSCEVSASMLTTTLLRPRARSCGGTRRVALRGRGFCGAVRADTAGAVGVVRPTATVAVPRLDVARVGMPCAGATLCGGAGDGA